MNAASPDPQPVLQREYDGDLVTLRAARAAVIDWLAGLGADDDTRERAALIVSELSSNAIQAAPGRTYSLQVRLDDGCATISVRNSPTGSRPPARESWRPEPATQLRNLLPRGRGLAIVDSLSEDVTVEHHGDDVVVAARVRINYKELGPSW
jgi:anti-sigma regulatory factor (Ser/Thr protein kinase)